MENLFEEIVAENFPNLVKKTDVEVQKVQRVTDNMNSKRSTSRHIIKVLKSKDGENFKSIKCKTCYVQGNSHKIISLFFRSTFAHQKGVTCYTQSAEI